MRKIIFIGCLLLFKSFLCCSQVKKINFSLNGIVNIDTGKVVFELVADTSYYPNKMVHLKAKIVDGEFYIEGFIEHPFAYQISINDRDFITEIFVIDTGKQTININASINKSTPKIDNAIMDIDYKSYRENFEKVRFDRQLLDSKWDSLANAYSNKIPNNIQEQLDKELKQNYRENDIALLNYVKEKPNSYYALWKLISLTRFGYEDIFYPIYNQFSDSLKNSSIGKNLQHYLDEFSLRSLGIKLKSFSAVDILKNENTYINYKINKYTLLDFWYSNCGPCIAQFPEMSSVYEDYHADGFEIIGISTDKISKKESWQKVIKTHHLQWPQLLDANGVESAKLGINVFPSNILVNNSGQIVGVNMLPSELRSYLTNK